MLNSSHIRKKIDQSPKLRSVLAGSRDNPRETIDRLYLSILSRPPSDAERISIREYLQSGSVKGREAMVDLAWALINSSEFLHRH
jgi:hypothetical protein